MRNWLREHLSEDAKNVIWFIIVLAVVILGFTITYYLLINGLWWVLIIGAIILMGIAALENRQKHG